MTPLDYSYLLGLSALWGSSYLFIKIAVEGHLAPAEVVLLRVGIATLVLYAVARMRGLRVPRDWRIWRSFAVMGVVGAAMPFFLITWGETEIDSSLAAILNATVPIFTVLLAHFWTRDERFTVARVLGVLIGFVGVVVLVGNVRFGGHSGALAGVIALLLSSLCYGIANTYARGAFHDVAPELASMGQMLCAAVCLSVPGILGGVSAHQAATAGAFAAAVALSLLGTVGAYLLYYRLMARVGATRTASVAYLLPAFAVVYGAVFLHELLSIWQLLGFALILLGVAVVNGRIHPRRSTESAAEAGAAR